MDVGKEQDQHSFHEMMQFFEMMKQNPIFKSMINAPQITPNSASHTLNSNPNAPF